jgi:circadian clock protein KaiC
MLLRLVDFLQNEGITVMLTALTSILDERMDEGVSSLVDAWISVRDIEANGERNRTLYIMKSRGMKHSNKVREFVISSKGLDLIEAYRGEGGNIIIGSEREMMEKQKRSGSKQAKNVNKKG